MSTVDPTTTENPNKFKKTYKYFDLETFENKSEEVEGEFVPVANIEEASTKVSTDELLAAVNAYLKSQVLAAMEKSVSSKGGKKSVVFAVIRPFRQMPPFNTIGATKGADGKYITDKDGSIVISDRAAQTNAILNMVKKNPDMIESIKAASLEAPAEDEGVDSKEE